MVDLQKYFSNYKCPKCCGHSCITSETTMGGVLRRIFARPKDNRYLIVTCALCGYSEWYSLKILAMTKSDVPAEKTQPAVENAD